MLIACGPLPERDAPQLSCDRVSRLWQLREIQSARTGERTQLPCTWQQAGCGASQYQPRLAADVTAAPIWSLSASAADRRLCLHAAQGGILTRQSSMGQALSGFMRTGLQQPMSRAMTAVSEGSMAALQAPVTLALASARMGSGVIMVGARLGCLRLVYWVCCATMVDHRQQQLHSLVMSLTSLVDRGPALERPDLPLLLPAKHVLHCLLCICLSLLGLTSQEIKTLNGVYVLMRCSICSCLLGRCVI